jgi:hypothetical protein
VSFRVRSIRLARSRLGWGFLAAHLACASLIVSDLWTFDEVGCTEAVVPSPLDGAVAGRLFFFNYASPVAKIAVLVDLPALFVGSYLETAIISAIPARVYERLTFSDLSWLRTPVYLLTTSLEWFVLGCLAAALRERYRSATRCPRQRPPSRSTGAQPPL